MGSPVKSSGYVPPVRCPRCGERQNRFSGRIVGKDQSFDKIDCMVCGHVFDLEEYQALLAHAHTTSTPPVSGQE